MVTSEDINDLTTTLVIFELEVVCISIILLSVCTMPVGDLIFINKDVAFNFTSSEATLAGWMTLPLPLSVLRITVLHDSGQSTIVTIRHYGSTVEYEKYVLRFPVSLHSAIFSCWYIFRTR